jgi:rhodanese-related sulfurtransferase
MKELEKIKRISIASTLFILLVIIGLLTYKRPKFLYDTNTKTALEKITNDDYLVTINEVYNPDYVLIDVRNQFEFEKGHLENAINIYTPEILNDKNSALLNELKERNKTAILYGNNPDEVNAPFLLLYQLGYENIKLLAIENSYLQNKLITKNSEIEKSEADIRAFIIDSHENSDDTFIEEEAIIPPKKIIVRAKKKKVAEGGC